MRITAVLSLFAALPLPLVACDPNVTGNLSADSFGDLSHPLAERGPPDVELRAACGDPSDLAERSPLVDRSPYVQEVTTDSALVLWTETAGLDAAIRLTHPDGTDVEGRAGAADPAGEGRDGTVARWAQLDGLTAATPYCVQLVDASGAELTPRIGFRTAPEPGRGARVRFLAFGDSGGGGSDQRALAEQMRTVPFELMVHTGDLAYDAGTVGQLEDKFFGVYGDLLGSFPVYPASGNHDYRTDDAAPFRAAFPLARGTEAYSFDWGDVHFAVLDTERIGAEQAAWLDRDLTDSTLPWTIVVGHRPPFSSGRHGSSDEFRSWFCPVLERHRVPLVLSGHDHHYERTSPQNGVTYVVTGGGGRGTYPVRRSSFTAFAEPVIHLLDVEIEGDLLTLHAIDGTGREFDSLRITR